jgi:hypothetical protein
MKYSLLGLSRRNLALVASAAAEGVPISGGDG